MSKKIRWAILGTGKVAQDVAGDFPQVQGAELYAVGSRNQATAKEFADRYRVDKAYGSYAELLNDNKIDVVYIATPHHLHKVHCLQAFETGKAVLCEKPFTLNAIQAEEVVIAARKNQIFCMEAMWMRFIPVIREVKKRVDAGKIGEVKLLKADFGYPARFTPENRLFNRKMGGGSLLDRGIYTISLAFHLIGKPINFHSHAAIGKSGVDDQSAYLLGYENGAIADLAASLQTYGTNEAVIMGDKGQIRIHEPFYRPSSLSVRYFPEPRAPAPNGLQSSSNITARLKRIPLVLRIHRSLSPVLNLVVRSKSVTKSFPGNGYQFEIAEVTKCLQIGKTESSIMPLDETLAIMQIMDEMRKNWGLRYPKE